MKLDASNTTICFVLPKELKAKINEYCNSKLIPVNAFVRMIIRDYFDKIEKEEK